MSFIAIFKITLCLPEVKSTRICSGCDHTYNSSAHAHRQISNISVQHYFLILEILTKFDDLVEIFYHSNSMKSIYSCVISN